MPYWVTFDTGESACCVLGRDKIDEILNNYTDYGSQLKHFILAVADEARAYAKERWPDNLDPAIANIQTLPYAAHPKFGGGAAGEWALCYDPRDCAGRGSCPKDRACND